jgi:hypothetical protein
VAKIIRYPWRFFGLRTVAVAGISAALPVGASAATATASEADQRRLLAEHQIERSRRFNVAIAGG